MSPSLLFHAQLAMDSPPQSNFALDECLDSDFNMTMMSIIFDGMNGRNHFINAIRPHNMTPEGRERARQDYLRMKHLDSSSRWIKATDRVTGEMVGMAQWNVYTGEKPPEKDLDGPPGKWDSEDDKEWAVALFRSNMAHRREVLRKATGPVICTCLLDAFQKLKSHPSLPYP